MRALYLPDWKKKEWDEMTERNAHGKRLEAIADWCGCCSETEARGDYFALANILNAVNNAHDSRGYLPAWMLDTREQLRQTLRGLISEEYGAEGLKMINP